MVKLNYNRRIVYYVFFLSFYLLHNYDFINASRPYSEREIREVKTANLHTPYVFSGGSGSNFIHFQTTVEQDHSPPETSKKDPVAGISRDKYRYVHAPAGYSRGNELIKAEIEKLKEAYQRLEIENGELQKKLELCSKNSESLISLKDEKVNLSKKQKDLETRERDLNKKKDDLENLETLLSQKEKSFSTKESQLEEKYSLKEKQLLEEVSLIKKENEEYKRLMEKNTETIRLQEVKISNLQQKIIVSEEIITENENKLSKELVLIEKEELDSIKLTESSIKLLRGYKLTSLEKISELTYSEEIRRGKEERLLERISQIKNENTQLKESLERNIKNIYQDQTQYAKNEENFVSFIKEYELKEISLLKEIDVSRKENAKTRTLIFNALNNISAGVVAEDIRRLFLTYHNQHVSRQILFFELTNLLRSENRILRSLIRFYSEATRDQKSSEIQKLILNIQELNMQKEKVLLKEIEQLKTESIELKESLKIISENKVQAGTCEELKRQQEEIKFGLSKCDTKITLEISRFFKRNDGKWVPSQPRKIPELKDIEQSDDPELLKVFDHLKTERKRNFASFVEKNNLKHLDIKEQKKLYRKFRESQRPSTSNIKKIQHFTLQKSNTPSSASSSASLSDSVSTTGSSSASSASMNEPLI